MPVAQRREGEMMLELQLSNMIGRGKSMALISGRRPRVEERIIRKAQEEYPRLQVAQTVGETSEPIRVVHLPSAPRTWLC